VRILGDGWDRLAPVPTKEIDVLQNLLSTDRAVVPYPFLRVGQRVKVVRGPMIGVEGLLVQTQPDKGRLVISVSLLQQSVAVNVDCADVSAL
jgi:transcription antitermination factor NusG